jgi:hypothetical protein
MPYEVRRVNRVGGRTVRIDAEAPTMAAAKQAASADALAHGATLTAWHDPPWFEDATGVREPGATWANTANGRFTYWIRLV